MDQEKDYLEICKNLTEERLDWGNSSQWTNQDFEKLGELIFEKTKTRLSSSTLKRVWGKVKYESDPTLTTLNALALFLGYESWRNFRSTIAAKADHHCTNGHSKPEEIPAIQITSAEKVGKRAGWSGAKWVAVGASVIVLAIALSYPLLNKEIDPSLITFTARTVSTELPNSVVFDYSLKGQHAENVMIQQSWDPQRRDTVSPTGTQHTSLYYQPGFFQAKLLVDGKIIKEQEVFIKTDGWRGIIDLAPVPSYLSAEEIALRGNSMRIDANVLQSKTGKTVFNDVWTQFYHVSHFEGVSGDNLELSISLQNTSSLEESACRKTSVTLLGSDGVITLPLSAFGCTSGAFVFLDDVGIDGKSRDLSSFGCDFSKPQNLTCRIKDGFVTVFLNSLEIFTYEKKVGLGMIVGLIVGIEGAGEVLDVKISAAK